MDEKPKRMTLRLPLDLWRKLTAEAKANRRSLHAHILWILEQHFNRK